MYIFWAIWAIAEDLSVKCVLGTPLGFPVVPDVYKINDISYTVTVGDEIKPYYLNYNDLFVYTIAGLKELDSFVQKIPEYTSIKNLANIENLLNNQNNIIQRLNNKISLLENRIYLLERK